MSLVEVLKSKIDYLEEVIDAERLQVEGVIVAMQQLITELKENDVDETTLKLELERLDLLANSIKNIYVDVVNDDYTVEDPVENSENEELENLLDKIIL